ncbi:MAG: ATP-dependent 6-phosphofructokinase, partial [Defluviitaleaceae bacterium]|nr:ATP-dependent 6-phosphofructokinase [Defluviitaleaceae bacterium]
VRTASSNGVKVVGITHGYHGLITGNIKEMTTRSVSETIHRGGTVLHTSRCPEMATEEGCEKAANVCKVLGLDALIVIGGDGSIYGGLELARRGVNVICIPATIDLDLPCSDYTIGFDTAVNTGMEAINKIRDTSSSHERCSVVEVMGRNAGHIAEWCGITGGAEDVLLPEFHEFDSDAIIEQIVKNRASGKTHNLIIVAEGVGKTVELAKKIERVTGIETRPTILGYLQRGGSPTAVDRMHASVMGYTAVEVLLNGEQNKVIVYKDGKYSGMDIEEALAVTRAYDSKLYDIMKTLAS